MYTIREHQCSKFKGLVNEKNWPLVREGLRRVDCDRDVAEVLQPLRHEWCKFVRLDFSNNQTAYNRPPALLSSAIRH